MTEFAYQPTKLHGKPQPRYIFTSYRDKKKLGGLTPSKVYTLIDYFYFLITFVVPHIAQTNVLKEIRMCGPKFRNIL